jgi:hypothetical protein
MALIFPSNPTLNQIFSTGSLSWIWNGKSWNNGTSILVTSNLVSGSAQFTNGNSAAFDTTSNVTFGQVTAVLLKLLAVFLVQQVFQNRHLVLRMLLVLVMY